MEKNPDGKRRDWIEYLVIIATILNAAAALIGLIDK